MAKSKSYMRAYRAKKRDQAAGWVEARRGEFDRAIASLEAVSGDSPATARQREARDILEAARNRVGDPEAERILGDDATMRIIFRVREANYGSYPVNPVDALGYMRNLIELDLGRERPFGVSPDMWKRMQKQARGDMAELRGKYPGITVEELASLIGYEEQIVRY